MLIFTGKFNATQYSESDEVCVKVQKPACPWELYICRELRERLLYLDDDVNRDIVSVLYTCFTHEYSSAVFLLSLHII